MEDFIIAYNAIIVVTFNKTEEDRPWFLKIHNHLYIWFCLIIHYLKSQNFWVRLLYSDTETIQSKYWIWCFVRRVLSTVLWLRAHWFGILIIKKKNIQGSIHGLQKITSIFFFRLGLNIHKIWNFLSTWVISNNDLLSFQN